MRFLSLTTLSNFKGEGGYIVGRVAALGCKPIILLSTNYLAGKTAASLIAVVFMIIPLAIAASGFNSHRNFYKTYFDDVRHRRLKESYQSYVNALLFQILMLIFPLFFYVYWQQGELFLAFAVVAYFASERLADESQRFLIFKGSRAEWGHKILLKVCIQVLGTFAACAYASGDHAATAATGAVTALAIGNAVPYSCHLPWAYLPKKWSTIFGAWRRCWEQIGFWILSTATTMIAYMDRITVMIFQQSDMAMFTLLVSCLSLIQNAMEYFFFSMKRKDILQAKLNLRELFLSSRMYTIIGASVVIGLILSFIIIYIFRGQSIQQWSLIPIVLIGQISLALCLVIREIVYWNHNTRYLILLEVAFIVTVVVILLGLRFAGMDYVAALAILSGLLLGRLFLLSRLTAHPAHS